MVEYSVQNDLHPSAVNLLHKPDEQFITRLQICLVCRADAVLLRIGIPLFSRSQQSSAIHHDLSYMRIDIIIVLRIVFMIRRRYKKRIAIHHFHTKSLQIIQLVHNSLQIAPVELPHAHRLRITIPVIHLTHLFPNVEIFSCFHIIVRITITEAVCINLIHDRSLCPVRSRKSRNNFEIIIFHQLILCAPFIIVTHLFS